MLHPALRVLQLTDTHLFANEEGALLGFETASSFARVVTHAREAFHPVDLLLVTGDVSHDGSVESYRRFVSALDGFQAMDCPVHCLPGNHDLPDAMRKALEPGPLTYLDSFAQKGWRAILLDTTIPGSEGGRLSSGELERLDHELSRNSESHALVCLHHNPVPVGSKWLDTMTVENPEPFFEIIDAHPQVRGILWGHVHQDYASERNGVRLMASPSTCIQFAPHTDEFARDDLAPGFRWLILEADGGIESGVARSPSKEPE